uniref:Putative methyltransferase n=1 Tax=viral metagenome TaxID=1070528 RepID=A0A6M3LRG5_9ZZZZ
MKIGSDVADILANSEVNGNQLQLPNVQLERAMYVAVNKVLEGIGGKWNRKAKAHSFSGPVETILEEILLTGEYVNAKTEFQFFQTPDGLARRLVDMANIQEGETCLEPSAGRGRIAHYMPGVDCVELNLENREYLEVAGFHLVGDDFLNFNKVYDVIVANPPFAKQADISHVTHMIELARRRVVSVMSNSIQFRTNKKTTEFRELLDRQNGEIIDLPEGSFKESGTGVKACIICCDGGA